MKFMEWSLYGMWMVFFGTVMVAVGTSTVQAGNYMSGYDLDVAEERIEFLETFGEHPQVIPCRKKADHIIKLMTERDAGVTKEEHLQRMKDRYEKSKSDPRGAIPWHIYIDFGRMVRDVHRSAGSDAGRYNRTDADKFWGHEFYGCFTAQ